MENSLKQRIIGAIVLIALAIIFLPIILKDKIEREPFESKIPVKPISLSELKVSDSVKQRALGVSEKLDKVETELGELSAQANASSDEKMVAATEKDEHSFQQPATTSGSAPLGFNQLKKKMAHPIETTGKAQDKINAKFISAAWVIQVASFSSLENARKLVAKLKQAKYKAYRRKNTALQKRPIYQVFVGPYIEKSRASEDKPAVAELSNSKVLLLAFDPEKH